MPVFGLGVWQMAPGKETMRAVGAALEMGYRLIDTAALYGNEESVGAAVRASGVPRDEVFVTTKLWNDDQGFESGLKAFERSRTAIGLDYVDLYLIHWPVSGKRLDSWRALTRLLREGKCRAIGVSNFTVAHLEELRRSSDIVPAVNQVEFSPFLFQRELWEYCRRQRIQLEAYAPLTRGRRLGDPTLQRIAQEHESTPAQVMLRWGLAHAVVEIPKSSRPERIRGNAEALALQLSADEVRELDRLDEGYRTTWDPSRIP
ncbi:MAG TPA: aldo/keto reductase [Thermoplasmata archaeon]|nr:aldo/keto reductase [Thermoplasmata archaeon]